MRTFGIEHQRRSKDYRPRVSFSKNGTITLNKPLVELMDLKPSDCLLLAEDNGEWYITKGPDRGFPIRETKAGGYLFSCKSLTTMFMKENFDGYSGTIKCRVTESDRLEFFTILLGSFKLPSS